MVGGLLGLNEWPAVDMSGRRMKVHIHDLGRYTRTCCIGLYSSSPNEQRLST